MATKSGRVWVWTKQDLIFHNNDTKVWFTVPAWTKAYLMKPDSDERNKMQRYQDMTNDRIFLVKIEGLGRFIEKSKLMFEEEFNARRASLVQDGVLSKD
jgi:hypothetical protein